ncbi:MAG: IclR family transcriptional regulator C-terminal domain-containing protein [Victivallales bacterium]|nr:IclR family transcriptional regulator C-terminal domain-containing protein [Victivallales bacterium]
MIKVLDKTLGIIENVALVSPRPLSPGKLAELTGINKTTCSRIIKELVSAGYLMQVSRLEGYTVGPRAFLLKQHISYHEKLIGVSEPIIKACAEKIGESVLLVEEYNQERYILLHYSFNPQMNIFLNQFSFGDLGATVTGIMLLAHMRPRAIAAALKQIYERQSCERELFEAVRGNMEPLEFLDKLKTRDYLAGDSHELAVAAFPVYRNGKFIAALGVSALKTDYNGKPLEAVIPEVQAAARKISAAVSTITAL